MDGINWYGYVGNNPLNMIDPTGLREAEHGTKNEDEDPGNDDSPNEGRDKDDDRKKTWFGRLVDGFNKAMETANKNFTKSLFDRGFSIPDSLQKYLPLAFNPEAKNPKAQYIPLGGFTGAATIGGGYEVGFVYDSKGNMGLALTGEIGIGVLAEIDIPALSSFVNMYWYSIHLTLSPER